MANLQKALEDLDKSSDDLEAKVGAYVDAMERLKDVSKATKELESAIADTTTKLADARAAFDEYVKANQAVIEKSKQQKEVLKAIHQKFTGTEEAIKKAQIMVNRHKA